MSKDSEDVLSERASQAAKIASSPSEYKICEGCGSIVALRVNLCPNCHSYRFDDEPASVIERAQHLGQQQRHRSVLASDLE